MSDYETRRRVMVDSQVRPYDVTKYPIIDAMLRVPRERFVPSTLADVAYLDDPIPLGGGRSILAPRFFARMLDLSGITKSSLVLVVGAGMGYGAAVIASIAEAVVALEQDEALASEAQAGLPEVGADNVAVQTGVLAEGAPNLGPFDVIFIEGGVEHVPDSLTEQLSETGRIVAIFMDGPVGKARIGIRADGQVNWRYGFDATADILPGFQKERSFSL